ncbi:MAG: Rieske 2Fe-2S domain-containing protein [Candidatus Dormibacteria bacterium]
MGIRDVLRPLQRWEQLDPAGEWLSGKVNQLVGTGPLKSLLSGTWLGHPLHPLLTDVPIGALTAATVIDVLGGEDSAAASDALTVLGLLAVAPTAVSGLSDWADTVGPERRLGLVHALANAGGSALFLAALLSRRSGNRGTARLFSAAGLGALSAGGYIGGHLVFARGIGVDHTVFDEPPESWTRVARQADVQPDTPLLVHAGAYGILLYSHAGTAHAIAARCTHAGGPLAEGEVDSDLCVTCPWHGSRFRLADGSVAGGPATSPQPAFEVRVSEGSLEVRVRPE